VDVCGFEPIATAAAKVLVLGTLPSQESLRRGEYYANPQNAFWPIMEAIFGISAKLPYAERSRSLSEAGVALWDVCAAAHRPGSLDASIRRGSEIANDFAAFLKQHRQLKLICFNGAKAGELFLRQVKLEVPMQYLHLPSTSPANAKVRLADKIESWSAIRAECES
jgi:double-stranded uracil-DNA glycosylase